MSEAVTRGYGLLERFLARKRATMADRLVPEDARQGRILDIGSGTSPHFLLNTRFAEKHGIDKVADPDAEGLDGVRLVRHDFEHDPSLPYEDGYFDVVTMLAVFEHIEPEILTPLFRDVHRVLGPDGTFIMTTPAGWADPILRLLARLGMVSTIEIEDHKGRYDHGIIRRYLTAAGFDPASIRQGSFELFMNLWATARP